MMLIIILISTPSGAHVNQANGKFTMLNGCACVSRKCSLYGIAVSNLSNKFVSLIFRQKNNRVCINEVQR